MGRQLGCSSISGCLIRRLSSFLLHRLPRFGLGLLWIYPPALSCQPLCLVLQAFEPFSPCCSGTLAGLRALVPPRSHREVEQTFPACPAAWLDRARVLGSANLSPRARILRAWKAGWARLVLAGDCAAPLPSETLQLASRFYPVVGDGSVRPALYTSFRAYSSSGALVLLTICLARLLL